MDPFITCSKCSLVSGIASGFKKHFCYLSYKTADLLCKWYSAGNALLNEEGPSNPAQPLPWKEKEDSLES